MIWWAWLLLAFCILGCVWGFRYIFRLLWRSYRKHQTSDLWWSIIFALASCALWPLFVIYAIASLIKWPNSESVGNLIAGTSAKKKLEKYN
jgi:TRAP-type C4-dicarboxylate transport system permease small subunit